MAELQKQGYGVYTAADGNMSIGGDGREIKLGKRPEGQGELSSVIWMGAMKEGISPDNAVIYDARTTKEVEFPAPA